MSLSGYIKIFFAIVIVVVCNFNIAKAQWVNDPASNTKLVTDPVDPVNISAVNDLDGGAYIFWQDKKNNAESDIYYLRIDQNGNASFRSDGKTVTTSNNLKENPIAVSDPEGNSIVLWKEFEKKNNPELYIQKLSKNGLRLWGTEGLKLTDTKSVVDYSLRTDKKSYSYVSYVNKTNQVTNKYYLKFQKINPNGKVVDDSTKGTVYNTTNTISESEIIPDNKGGAYFFWLENISQKTVLRALHVDSVGSKKWGNKPISISKINSSVINYSVGRLGKNIYAAIMYQGAKKIVYQQLISEKGSLLWGNEGKLITYQRGSQTNPQFVFADSSVVVSWTNEFEKLKEVFIQRFDMNGNPLWIKNGKKIINIVGNQFGQRLIYDNKGGVIIAWIDKKDNDSYANLYIQKVDLKGNFIWNPEGVKISSSQKLQKSYLNLVSDNEGGAIAIFRGSAEGRNDIYGQKIFSTGTYASQVLGFSSEVVDDSVKISWYAANETDGTTYFVQRSDQSSTANSNWTTVGTLKINNKKKSNYYEFYDVPEKSGSIFYRIVQKNSGKELQVTSPSKVDYFRNVESIILGQNSPNPFTGTTTITFYLPEEEKVTLEIFNSSIETVQKIENKIYPAGKNSYVFNANGLKPGVYFYRLKVADFVDVKKMVVAN